MKKSVSLKKLSEITGYSVATISRVINKKGKYSVETEKKVLKAIKEYNYVPNVIARSLRTNHSPTIGIIVPDITNEFFSRITLAVQLKLLSHGFTAIVCNTNENKNLEERYMQMLQSQNISGIIYICCKQLYDGNYNSTVPKVYIDRKPTILTQGESPIIVQSDNYEGGRLAVRELINSGCKNIISIMDKRDLSSKISRQAGIIDELKAHDMEAQIYYTNHVTYKGIYSVIKKILDNNDLSFDGIFCYNDIGAMSVVKALSKRNIKIPESVKIMGFDGISCTKYCTPSISTIRQPMEKMGKYAAQIILRLINREKIEEREYNLPVKLIKRQSTMSE
ncbi:MAG: LacI family DNA-binding transcriptional regulator [Saccharofermentanales bacterium]|jgi:LacI family transcriptional regulator